MTAALAAYCERLVEKFGTLELRALSGFRGDGAGLGLDLAAIFVQSRLVAGDARRTLADAFAGDPCVVIHGEPGAGKTTLLRWLCLAHAHPDDHMRAHLRRPGQGPTVLPQIPVFLQLARFPRKRGTVAEFTRFIRRSLAEDDFESSHIAAVMAALEAGRGLLCLDGLDECGDEAQLDRIVCAFEAWTRRYGGRCWVTTRTHGATPLAPRFQAYTLTAFTTDDVHEYVRRREWLRSRDPQVAAAAADAWLRRFAWRDPMSALVRQPLLLVLTLAAEAPDRVLPAERVHLYERAIRALVIHWNRSRRLDALRRPNDTVVDPEAVLRAIARVALWLHQHGRLGRPVHHRELHRLLTRDLGDATAADGALEVLVDQAGLLERVGEDLRFWHTTFGEYLAATALADAARGQPWRLLATAGSSQGRELVRMTISLVRCVQHDGNLASQLFDQLLAPAAGGPWTRMFAANVRLAVDCVQDNHPLGDAAFNGLVERVLELVERAPLWQNAKLLGDLVAARPDHECPEALLLRMIALVRHEPRLLTSDVTSALMRWIARAARHSAAALAGCEQISADWHFGEREWSALGLLRAGVIRDALCRTAVGRLSPSLTPAEATPELEIAGWIAPARDVLVPALHALLADTPPRPWWMRSGDMSNPEHVRVAAAALLALLDADSEVVRTTLGGAEASDRASSGPQRVALAWLAYRHESARRWLGDALLNDEAAIRGVAVEVLRAMLRRADQAEVAAETIVTALRRAPERLPAPAELLHAPHHAIEYGRRESSRLDSLRQLLAPDREFIPHLGAAWSAIPAAEHAVRWLLAALLWPTARRSDGPVFAAIAALLFASQADTELSVAVLSASLLDDLWTHLDESLRLVLVQTWLRGLTSPGSGIHGEPVDAACSESLHKLRRRREDLTADASAALQAALTSAHAIQATAAALILLPDPEHAATCWQILSNSLESSDSKRVHFAQTQLRHHHNWPSELLERWHEATVRLTLLGEIEHSPLWLPATRTMVELFLTAPCPDPRSVELWPKIRVLENWVIIHPDAFTLGLASLAAADRSQAQRAESLLALGLDTPARIDALLALASEPGTNLAPAVERVLSRAARFVRDDALKAPMHAALLQLLTPRLRSADLATVEDTVDILDTLWVRGTDDLPAARGRLLDAGEPAWRREAVHHWLTVQCPPERREEYAQRYFNRSREQIAAALRPDLVDADRLAAVISGMLLRQVTGESAALHALCRAIVAGPAQSTAPPAEVLERTYQRRFLLNTDAARELSGVLRVERLDPAWRWALLVLDDLGDPAVARIFCDTILEPAQFDSDWHLPSTVEWLFENRPDWVALLEPKIVAFLARAELMSIPEIATNIYAAGARTEPILMVLGERWAEALCADSDLHPNFLGGPAIFPLALRARWREQVSTAQDPAVQRRAALALAVGGETSEAIVDALIDAVLTDWSTMARRAFLFLQTPAHAALFANRRRLRTLRAVTPDAAFEVSYLWTAQEIAADLATSLPMLRTAARSDDPGIALQSAESLHLHDAAAAVEAISALVPRSTDAAVWLFDHGHHTVAAESRLWWSLEHPEIDRDCEHAARVLAVAAPEAPRLIPALTEIAGCHDSDASIWLLAGLSHHHSVVATLERLARERYHISGAARWLLALDHGRRPGRPPPGAAHESEDLPELDVRDLELDGDRRSLRALLRPTLQHASTLDGVAAALLELAPKLTTLDLSAATATLLAWDPARLSGLWKRARDGVVTAAEIDEIRRVVELRPDDRPGRRLARLWWRIQLPEAALLERDIAPLTELVARGSSPIALLVELLREGYTNADELREFMAGLGLGDELRPVALAQLRVDAADLLLRHGADAAVERLAELGAISRASRQAWFAHPRVA